MTDEQIDELRPSFEKWARKKHAYSEEFHMGFNYTHNEYYTPETQTEWSAWQAAHEDMQAARALPAGMEPQWFLHIMDNTEGIPGNVPHQVADECDMHPFGKAGINYSDEFSVKTEPLYTVAQMLAMGRVPPGFAAVPAEPTTEMVEAAAEAYMPFGDMALAIQSAIAAAPQPLAAQDSEP